MKKQFFIFVLTLLPLVANADDSGKCGDNVYYSYNSTTHTLTISGEGTMESWDPSEDGIHPKDYRPWRSYSQSIKTIIIEYGVSSIGNNAFYGCSNLKAIISEIENPKKIETDVFGSDDKDIYATATLIVPGGKKYAYQATEGWNKFQNIVDGTYENPQKLTIHVPAAGTLPYLISDYQKYQVEELTLIGDLNGTDFDLIRKMAGANYRERSGAPDFLKTEGILKTLDLTDVRIVKGGKKYFSDAWGTRTGGDDYYTEENHISYRFFFYTNLETIIIPNSVTNIDPSAFEDCERLTTLVVGNDNHFYDSRNNCNAIIESRTKQLIAGCKSTVIPIDVTSIGERAFYRCSGLTSITIPNSVTSIGGSAFDGCSSLASITIPNSVTNIGSYAFYRCSGLTSITIPNSVTSIGGSAFNGCSSLASITIPNSVTSIGSEAFRDCSGLTSIEIPNSVTSIGNSAFYGCSGLTSITIPNSVTSIGDYAFYGTAWYNNQPDGLVYAGKVAYEYKGEMPANTSMSIKDGTLGIAGSAFNFCSGLTSITIPNSVTSIGSSAFYFCSGLTSITIPNSVTSIGDYAFYGTAWYNNQPDGLVYAGKVAYEYKGEMPANTSMSIKDGTLGIAGSAFRNCSGLTSITIPNSVTSIGSSAFYFCSGLTSITIPNSVTSIGDYAFYGCSNLKAIILEIENPKKIETDLFGLYYKDIYATATLIVPGGKKYAYQATEGWNKFQNIVEADEITDNDVNYALEGETAVVSMSTSVKGELRIEESVEIDGKTYQVTAIASGAFQGNVEITSVVIPNSIETIGASAFEGCTGISTIIIGKAVKEIASRAFAEIFSNKTGTRAEGVGIDVYCYAEEVPITGGDAFDGTPTELSTLHVPLSSIEKYRTTWPWSDFKEIVPLANTSFTQNGINYAVNEDGTLEVVGIEDGTTIVDILSDVYIDGNTYQVTSIGAYAFEGRSDIEYLSIPWSVKSIGEYAFIDCGSDMTVNIADPESWCQMKLGNEHSSPLSSAKKVLVHDIETDQIDIPEGVTSINSFTFYQCRSIKSLNIPATVTSIGSSAFEDCTGLTALSLSEGLETIGGSAFQGCTGLQTLTIPSTVKSIYINALANCKGITDVYCYAENIPETDFDAFDSTPTEKSTLHVPANAVEAYKVTWPWSDFKEIVALDEEAPDGINGVKQSDGIKAVYSVRGEIIQRPLKGINIIKMKDGTVKKVFLNR